MRLVFVGLGKMGSQLVTKILQNGHQVVAIDPSEAAVQAMVQLGAETATDRADAVQKVASEPKTVVWLMIPSEIVESELQEWLAVVPAGAIIVDGGNSPYKETMRRAEVCVEKQVSFVDVGTSGGVLGLKNGFSMMVGGDEASVAVITPILEIFAQPNGGFAHFGPSGYGHYIKMIHNGIEYGMMQAYAEGYRMLHDGDMQGIDLAKVADVWQKGSIISSKLNGLVQDIYTTNPELDGIDGYVKDSGEGRWMLESAQHQEITLPALAAALLVRVSSQNGRFDHSTKLLAAMRNSFGGHAINKEAPIKTNE